MTENRGAYADGGSGESDGSLSESEGSQKSGSSLGGESGDKRSEKRRSLRNAAKKRKQRHGSPDPDYEDSGKGKNNQFMCQYTVSINGNNF